VVVPGVLPIALREGSFLAMNVSVCRRVYALLGLGALLNAQAAVIGCPLLHHGHDRSEASIVQRASSNPLHQHNAPAEQSDHSRHGSTDDCAMLLTCSASALLHSGMPRLIGPSNDSAAPRVRSHAYHDPSISLLKPPPRSA
jgi:hypothetical protein